jgi:membrane fusion protein, multidrug efflux system
MKNFLTLLVFAATLASCGGGSENKEDQLKAKKEAFEALRNEIAQLELEIAKEKGGTTNAGKPVKLQTLALDTFVHSIDIQGRVDAEESVSVGPQMPGLVKRVHVHAGDKVSAGQVLAELDADAMGQQLASLKTQRDLAKQVYDRQKNLWDQKIGTEIQFLQTKAQYEAMESQVAALGEQIGMSKITAPISGVIDAVNIKAGEMASPGFSNIVIVNTSNLRVKGEVAEGYISKVKTGSPVSVYLPDAGKTIPTKVTYAGRMINNLNRTFNVEVALAPNEQDVVPNMLAVLKINDYQNDKAIIIPLAIIQQNANGTNYVFVAVTKEKTTVAEKREITYSWTYNGMAEVTSGLQAGDQLIIEGANEMNPGDVVAPIK